MAHQLAHQTDHPAEAQHGMTPRQYIMLGVILTMITVIELAVSFAPALQSVLVPILLVLSAIKFAAVVAYFMHLRFESKLLAQVFTGSLILAILILMALAALFWGDYAAGIRANRGDAPAPAAAPKH